MLTCNTISTTTRIESNDRYCAPAAERIVKKGCQSALTVMQIFAAEKALITVHD
jgi:hypothetical protein